MMKLVEKTYLTYEFTPLNSINDVINVYNDVVNYVEKDYKNILEI